MVSCAVGPGGFLGWAAPAPCEDGTVCMGAGKCTPPGELEVWPEAVSGRPDLAAMAGCVAGKGGAARVVARFLDAL